MMSCPGNSEMREKLGFIVGKIDVEVIDREWIVYDLCVVRERIRHFAL